MNIHYGTVTLRAIEESDLPFCREMINSSYLEGCTVGTNLPVSEDEQRAWFQNHNRQNEIRLMIENKNGPIGMIMVTKIDWINRSGSGGIKLGDMKKLEKGNTQDAVTGLMKYLFEELNFHCIYASVLEDNLLSRRILIDHGFTEEGVLRGRVFKRGAYRNLISYSMLSEEYMERIQR